MSDIARVLAEHTGWSQTGPDVHGAWEVECFDCGAGLGDSAQFVAAWEARTGKSHAEASRRGSAPAYDEALAAHQAEMLAPLIRQEKAEAWGEGYSAGYAARSKEESFDPGANPYREAGGDRG